MSTCTTVYGLVMLFNEIVKLVITRDVKFNVFKFNCVIGVYLFLIFKLMYFFDLIYFQFHRFQAFPFILFGNESLN